MKKETKKNLDLKTNLFLNLIYIVNFEKKVKL